MLDRFIFCPCKHALEVHTEHGCTDCRCAAGQREVIDGLLERERDEIHRAWLSPSRAQGASVRAAP